MSERDCPSRDQMAAYLSGSLEAPAADRLVSHLEGCADCQAALQTLSDVGDTLLEQLRAQAEDSPYVAEPECQRVVELAVAGAEARESAAPSVVQETAEVLPAALGQLAEYQVLAKLGRGGMGAVYKARHTRLGRNVAIKVLLEGRSLNEQAVARFLREMKAVGGLSHPNIVHAYDAREVGGAHVLVMEYVDGLSVGDLLRRLGPLPVAGACEVMRQAATGLDYAHRQGLVHRDVKPTNLMLDRQGQVKILDLGLALLASDQLADEEITGAGEVMGTADYMAPEQVSDSHNVDARADIYSLGCALYALLAGRPPFHAVGNRSVAAKMMAHLHEEPPPIGEVRPDVPAGLAVVLRRMMAKRPEDRLATADDVRAALSPFCPGANLPRLLSRASAPSVAQLAGPAAQPEPLPLTHTGTVVPAAKAAEKQRKLRPIAALVATAPLFAAVVLGIIIKIRTKDGQDITIHAPAGTAVTIEEDGKPVVALPGQGDTKPPEASKPVAMKIEPEPPATQVGEPLSSEALVARPARIPALRSWTIETRGHRGPVNATAVQPGGKLFASGGHDGSVRIWETATGRLVRVLVGAGDAVPGLAWSPDGAVLAFVAEKQLQLWDVAAGKRLRTLTAEDTLYSLAWSPEGKELAAGQLVGAKVHIWDPQSGALKKTIQPDDPAACMALGLAWLPDGRRLLIAHGISDNPREFSFGSWTAKNKHVLVWDTAENRLLHREKAEVISTWFWLALARDGKQFLLGGGETPQCQVWKIESDHPVKVRDLDAEKLSYNATFSPDSKTVIYLGAGDPGRLAYFELTTGKLQGTRLASLEPEVLLTAADDKTLLCGSAGGGLAGLDLSTGRVLWDVPGTHLAPSELKWSHDGTQLAIGYLGDRWGNTGQARVASVLSGRVGELPMGSYVSLLSTTEIYVSRGRRHTLRDHGGQI